MDNKLKIALFCNIPPGGAKRALFNFTKELHSRGHYIDCYRLDTFDDVLFSPDSFVDTIFMYNLKRLYSFRRFLPYFMSECINLVERIKYLIRLNSISKRIAKDINKKKYDLAFVHNCVYAQAPFLLRYLKIPTVYYCNEPLRRAYEPKVERVEIRASFNKTVRSFLWKPADIIGKMIAKKIDRVNILSADFVFSNSYYTRESTYKAYGILSMVSYPGVDIEKFRPLNLCKENYVLSIGVIDYLKKHDFAIDSLALIDKSIRPKLIIIGNFGSENEKEFIMSLAKAKDVDLEIKLLIDDDELIKLYNEAKIVIYAPLMEPFGLVPLEAMACGTPVIGVKEGGIRETIIDGETGILIDRDGKECADAIKRLLLDEELCRRLGEKGREHVCKNWSWQKCTDRLEENFRKILNNSKK